VQTNGVLAVAPKILNRLCLTEKAFLGPKKEKILVALNLVGFIKITFVSGLIFLARPPSLIAH